MKATKKFGVKRLLAFSVLALVCCSIIALAISKVLAAGPTFSTINPPAAVSSIAVGINHYGQIVGRYADATGITHGFLLSNGSFIPVADFPGSIETAFDGTFVGGLNRNGDIVSDYCNLAPCPSSPADFFSFPGSSHGFQLRGGVFTTIDFPGAINTVSFGINGADEIVGGYFDQNGHDHGYLRTP